MTSRLEILFLIVKTTIMTMSARKKNSAGKHSWDYSRIDLSFVGTSFRKSQFEDYAYYFDFLILGFNAQNKDIAWWSNRNRNIIMALYYNKMYCLKHLQ
jgi:hypothetical protein